MRRLLGLAVLLLVGLGSAWWLTRGAPSSAAQADIPSERVASRESSHGLETLTAPDSAAAPARSAAPAAEPAGQVGDAGGFLVRVIDSRGNYATGVPIGVCRDEARSKRDIYTVNTEGAAGIASFGDLARRVSPLDPRGKFYVHVALLGMKDVGETVDLSDLPREPLLLRLPPHGSVEILVHDSQGNAVDPGFVRMGNSANYDRDGSPVAAPATPGGRTALQRALDFGEFAPVEIGPGRALYPYVPLGLELFVHVSTELVSRNVHKAGPRSEGELVFIHVDVGAPGRELQGRLVDERGNPVTSCDFSFQFSARVDSEMRASAGSGRTDPAGRFFVLVPSVAPQAVGGSIRLTPKCQDFGGTASAEAALDSRILTGANELGDLVVRRPESLATGRVVDDFGAPVSGALVDVFVASEADPRSPWKYAQALGGRSGEDGSFLVRSALPSSRFKLRASRRGHLDAHSPEFTIPVHGVVLSLTRTSQLGGTAILDDFGASAKIWASAVRASDSDYHRQLFRDRERALVDRFGAFHLEDVRPGTCDLAFVVEGVGAPVLVLEGIELRPGERALDARLASIDLRGKIPLDAPQAKKER